MREHQVNQLDNFICGWYIDTSVCDELLDYYHKSWKKAPGCIGSEEYAIPELKDSIDVQLEPCDLANRYIKCLAQVKAKYIEKYPNSSPGAQWDVTTLAQIQHYKPKGGFHVWHCERCTKTEPLSSRHLTFMTYLNDVNDQGETEWFHQKLKIKPEKGLTILWPVDWTHTHRGVPSPTEDKYIVTGWFNYIE